MRKISCFRLIFRQRFGGYEVGAFRAGRHAIGKRLIAFFKHAKVLVKNFSHGAPPKFFSGGSAARRLRLNLTSRHPHVLVKGAACGTCLPLTSARGCATPGCTNFLTGAFPARGEKAVYGPRAASGGAPTRHMPAPPRARGAGRARGARTICTNQSPERQRGSTEPQGSTGLVRGGESRRARAGSGCAAAALWAAIQCRAYLERGVWGVAHVGRPSPSDEAPGRRARGHEERVSKPPAQTSGERARRPEGEGAAAAAHPASPGVCRGEQ